MDRPGITAVLRQHSPLIGKEIFRAPIGPTHGKGNHVGHRVAAPHLQLH